MTLTLHALYVYITVTHFTSLLGFRVFWKLPNVVIASMYFGNRYHSSFCSRVPGSSSSESATNSAPLADLSSTSLDRDGDHAGYPRTRTGPRGSNLYSEMRISLMFAVKSKRSWTSTLFSCALWQYNSHPLITATLSTRKKIRQYHLQLF